MIGLLALAIASVYIALVVTAAMWLGRLLPVVWIGRWSPVWRPRRWFRAVFLVTFLIVIPYGDAIWFCLALRYQCLTDFGNLHVEQRVLGKQIPQGKWTLEHLPPLQPGSDGWIQLAQEVSILMLGIEFEQYNKYIVSLSDGRVLGHYRTYSGPAGWLSAWPRAWEIGPRHQSTNDCDDLAFFEHPTWLDQAVDPRRKDREQKTR